MVTVNLYQIRVHNERIELNLRDVKKGFPLPGSYHFRFLTTIGAYTAWLDILNDEDIVPLYNGGYFCKVTRTMNIPFRDSTASSSGASFIVKEKISPAVHNDHASPPRVVAKPAKLVPNPNLSFATSTAKPAPAPIPASAPAEKLLRFDDDGGDDDFSAFASSPAAATTAPSALLLEEDLLGMDTNATATSSFQSTAATHRATSSAVDLLGLDAIQPTPVTTSAAAPMRPQRTAASTLPGSQSPIPPSRSNPAINVMGGMSSQNPAAQSNLRGMGMGSSGNLNSLGMGGVGGGVGRGSASMPMNGGRLGQGQGAYDPFNDLTGLNPSNSGATNRAAQQQQRR
eukprot:gene25635-34206_t